MLMRNDAALGDWADWENKCIQTNFFCHGLQIQQFYYSKLNSQAET